MSQEYLDEFMNVSVSVQDTWSAQKAKTSEMMIRDIVNSIHLDREKMKNDSSIEPFSFSELVKSAKKTIWVEEHELKEMCQEALFRCLDPRDYRYGHKELFLEDLK